MSVGVFVPKSESCIKYKYITMHLPSGSGYEASTPHIATVKVTRRWHLHCNVCVCGGRRGEVKIMGLRDNVSRKQATSVSRCLSCRSVVHCRLGTSSELGSRGLRCITLLKSTTTFRMKKRRKEGTGVSWSSKCGAL
jgi:hypothetical protein